MQRLLVYVCLLCGLASVAHAQPYEWRAPRPSSHSPLPPGSTSAPEESDKDAAPAGEPARPPLQSSQPTVRGAGPRPRPAYAPAGPAPAGSAWLWVPRVILFPVYVVSEYVVRWPLVSAGRHAEQHRWPQHVVDFFTFGPRNQAQLWPLIYVDLGFQPRAGLSFAWDHALLESNRLRARAEASARGSLTVSATNSYAFAGGEHLALAGSFWHRPDLAFWGPGPESGETATRYLERGVSGVVTARFPGWRTSDIRVALELEDRRFDTGDAGGASLDAAVSSGRLEALPPGTGGYTRLSPVVHAALDTRRSRVEHAPDFVAPPGTGLRLAARARYALDVDGRQEPGLAPSWVGYGALAGAYYDLTAEQRTLGLALSADFVRPLAGGSAVPFTEQPSLGGTEPMPGLRSRRLVGPSSVAARLQYRWPIWVSLDGMASAALGNVFGPELSGFRPDLLRASFAFGLRGIAAHESGFELLVGAGTSTLRSGAHFEEVRLALGTYSWF